MITDREFTLFRDFIGSLAGIHLGETKKHLLVGRLASRLRQVGCATFLDYFSVVRDDRAEQQVLIDAICTNTTSFFREPHQFRFLESELIPRWRDAGRPIRIWSAACATGQEPFSIAMAVRHVWPEAEVEIVATDVSLRALERARRGVWDLASANEIPRPYLERYMLRGLSNGKMKATPELLSMIRFARVNLHTDDFTVLGRFDAVFCRNALIYFGVDSRRVVLERVMRQIQRDGHLLLGHSESLHGITTKMRRVGPTVYAFAS